MIADQFPYDPERLVSDYIDAVRAQIGQIKLAHPDAYAEWRNLTQGYLKKYFLSDWSWYTWRNLQDASVESWNSVVEATVGVVDAAAQRSLSSKKPLTGEACSVGLGVQQQNSDLETADANAVTVWSNRIVLPLGHILLLLPLLFAASRFILADLDTQRWTTQAAI